MKPLSRVVKELVKTSTALLIADMLGHIYVLIQRKEDYGYQLSISYITRRYIIYDIY